MNKIKLVLPLLLVAGVIGCSFIDLETTADKNNERHTQDNRANLSSNPTDFTSKSHDHSPVGSVVLAAHTDYQQTSPHASIKPKRPATEAVSQNYDVTLESHVDKASPRKYSVKLGGRRIGPVQRIVESQSAPSNQGTLMNYADRKPALARHNNSAGKLTRRGKKAYLANKHAAPEVKSTQLAKHAAPKPKSTQLAKDVAPAINSTQLAKHAAPASKSTELGKDVAPEINSNSLAEDAIPLINRIRWVISI